MQLAGDAAGVLLGRPRQVVDQELRCRVLAIVHGRSADFTGQHPLSRHEDANVRPGDFGLQRDGGQFQPLERFGQQVLVGEADRVITSLHGLDDGPLVLGGFSASGGSGSSVQENVTTTARIPNGALIEREIKTVFATDGKVTLALRAPNFDTAQRICEGLNKAMGEGTARPLDGGSIEIKAPSELKNKPVELVSKLGDIDVEPGSLARVVLNERTGTIVAGGDVRLSPVAIAQGGITISVKESKEVSQPGILSRGTTAEVKRTDIEATEQKPPALTYVNGAASLAEVAQALSTFGVTPRELGSILQALKAAGALRAEVIVQ